MKKNKIYEFTNNNFLIIFKVLLIYIFFYIIYIRISYTNFSILSPKVILKYSLPIFMLHCISLLILCSREKININKDFLIIERKFLFFCYYKKNIKIENIEKIIFRKFLTKKMLFIVPFYFSGYSNLLIQVDEGKEENKIYYFGKFLKREDFLEIKENINNILEEKEILFLY